jgi:hypothetical protein
MPDVPVLIIILFAFAALGGLGIAIRALRNRRR